jgi:chondroitin 4-sulfotransferase 11
MIVNHKLKILFVHIHKTGGSSMRNALMNLEGSNFMGHHHTFVKELDSDKYHEYFKFAIVRNPWDRLVSWYYSILNLKGTNRFKEYFMSRCKNFQDFLNCTDIILESPKISKRVLSGNELLSNNPKMLYPKSISFNQIDYISNEKGLAVDYVGRFESINESWSHICSRIGIKISLPHDKKGSWSDGGITYKNFYKSNLEINKVKVMYARDIEEFGYEY